MKIRCEIYHFADLQANLLGIIWAEYHAAYYTRSTLVRCWLLFCAEPAVILPKYSTGPCFCYLRCWL